MIRPLSCLTAVGLAVLLLGTSATPQAPPPPVPPAPTCVVPPDEFKAWIHLMASMTTGRTCRQ
jgi:hypothetical protein